MASQGKAFSDLSDEVRKRPGAAEEIDARKRAIIAAVRLNELRKQRGQTQAQLADLLGMTQANVSRIERSDNLYLSTLADYVDALGGHIEINAVFDDDVVSLGPVEKDRRELPAWTAPRCVVAARLWLSTTENAPPGKEGRFWGYYREERYVSLYMLIRGR